MPLFQMFRHPEAALGHEHFIEFNPAVDAVLFVKSTHHEAVHALPFHLVRKPGPEQLVGAVHPDNARIRLPVHPLFQEPDDDGDIIRFTHPVIDALTVVEAVHEDDFPAVRGESGERDRRRIRAAHVNPDRQLKVVAPEDFLPGNADHRFVVGRIDAARRARALAEDIRAVP